MSWSPGGRLILSSAERLVSISATGGAAAAAAARVRSAGETSHCCPSALPDGRHFLYVAEEKNRETLELRLKLYVGSLDGQPPIFVREVQSRAAFVQGQLIFMLDGNLVAQPFDARTFRTTGEPREVASGVYHTYPFPFAAFSASQRALAYYPVSARPYDLLLVNRQGVPLRTVAAGRIGHGAGDLVRFSPDGSRLALTRFTGRGFASEIWIHRVNGDAPLRVVADGAYNNLPLWSADGRRVVYYRWGGSDGVYERRADGEGPIGVVLDDVDVEFPYHYSSDGQFLLYGRRADGEGTVNLWVRPLNGRDAPWPLVPETAGAEWSASFSPDSRWVAFSVWAQVRGEEAASSVSVKPFQPGASAWRVADSGFSPRWRSDGRELFYMDGPRVYAMDIDTRDGTVRAGPARPLFEMAVSIVGYDAAPDGQQFAVVIPSAVDIPPPPTTVEIDWMAGTAR